MLPLDIFKPVMSCICLNMQVTENMDLARQSFLSGYRKQTLNVPFWMAVSSFLFEKTPHTDSEDARWKWIQGDSSESSKLKGNMTSLGKQPLLHSLLGAPGSREAGVVWKGSPALLEHVLPLCPRSSFHAVLVHFVSSFFFILSIQKVILCFYMWG